METTIERIRTLRKAAGVAIDEFRGAMKEVIQFGSYEAAPDVSVHDNVRIVESDSESFEWFLDRDKHQVVVVLTGTWTMTHGNSVRTLGPTDTLKVPFGSPVDTIMSASEAGIKFVYIQFKM